MNASLERGGAGGVVARVDGVEGGGKRAEQPPSTPKQELIWTLSDPPRIDKTWLDEMQEQELELEQIPDHVEEVAPSPRFGRWWVGAMALGGAGLVTAAVRVALFAGVPTRHVALHLRSTPAAMVHVDGRRLGQTPLNANVRCRGWLTVSVHRPGYAGWHWSGVCPQAKVTLDARLLPYQWLTP